MYPLVVRMYQQLETSLKTTYKEINDQFVNVLSKHTPDNIL